MAAAGEAAWARLAAQVVAVTVAGPDPKRRKAAATASASSKDGETALSCSGCLLPGGRNDSGGGKGGGDSVVVAALTAVYPFLTAASKAALAALSSAGAAAAAAAPPLELVPGARIECAVEGAAAPRRARLAAATPVPGARATLAALLAAPSAARWELGWGEEGGDAAAALIAASHVAVLVFDAPPPAGTTAAWRPPPLPIAPAAAAAPGAALACGGAPFAAAAALPFRAYVARGAAAGAVPPPLLLADAAALPGMEGGPVVDAAGDLVGFLAPPLRAPGAQAALALVLRAAPVLAAAGGAVGGFDALAANAPSADAPRLPKGALRAALRAVVAVEAGGGWASGVLVSRRGHALTNAHAVAGLAPGARVRALVAGRWAPAELLHAFGGALDLAVLQILPSPASSDANSAPPAPIELAAADAAPGAAVAVAGFPLWRPAPGGAPPAPLISAGHVARVVARSGAAGDAAGAAMLLTTAAVHAGASGGAVLCPTSGALLGLVTSNARWSGGGGAGSLGDAAQPSRRLYPRLNFSLPASAMRPVVAALEAAARGSGKVDWAAAGAAAGVGLEGAWALRGLAAEGPGGAPAAPRAPPALAALLEDRRRARL
jgi:S1-C subfamily serine protease